MEKEHIVIGLIVVIGLFTVVFGKLIGPKLFDWITPSFNKAANELDDAITGKPDDWETKVREIVETKPEQLKERMAEIFSHFATDASLGSLPSTSLPQSAKAFFEKYSKLSFDGQTQILDASAVRIVTYKRQKYAVIGRSEDDGHFYAIDLQDKGKASVVRLEIDDNGNVFSVEEDAPSFQHFVTLQHELHLKSI